MRRKMAIVLAAILFVDVIGLGVIYFSRHSGQRPDISADAQPLAEASTTQMQELISTVSLLAVGDNLIHDTVYEQAAERASSGYDFSYCYEKVADRVAAADIAILNQETIISTEHEVSSYPMFNSPPEVGEEMIRIGFDVFNIATNHSLDCGEKGLISCINWWKSKGVITTGAFLNQVDYAKIPTNTVNGITFAYLGFTEMTNDLSLPSDSEVILCTSEDEAELQRRVMAAKDLADVVIVNAHWGIEYTHEPTDEQRILAKKLAAWGADVIIGNHPHVIQPVEFIENDNGTRTLVAYSLGNFISAQNRGARMLGGMLNFDISKNNANGDITIENVKFHGTVNHYGYNYSNIRIYMLEDYTEELASVHGVKSQTPSFSLQYLNDIVNEVIDKQFL
ncbi:MAG: CapA family protein [Clostridia bacterium]|nr:CapA family protein [Clostridia bacterium]